MARIRSLKPEFWDDRKLARSTSRTARMLYMGLWNQADEHGRLNGDPFWIKGRVFPYDDDITTADVSALLDELEMAGRVQRYEVDGDPFLFLPKLGKHQRLEPSKVESKIPEPPPFSDESKPRARPDAQSSQPRADSSERDADSSTLLYVAGSMEHVGSQRGAQTSERPRNEIWDAVVEVCGIDAKTTQTQATLIGKVCRELTEVDATPGQVKVRANRYRQRYRDTTLTPTALVKHWGQLGDAVPSAVPDRPQDLMGALSKGIRP